MNTLREVDLNLTARCNLDCKFCSVQVQPVTHRGTELDIRTLERLFVEFDQLGVRVIRLVGGEPFVRRDIGEIIALAGQFRFSTTILTNGTVMKRQHVLLAKASRVSHIAFSVDGPNAPLHDESRGKPKSFDRVVALMKECREASLPHRMMTAVTVDVIQRLKELVLFADRQGCEVLNFILLGLNGRALGARHLFPTYGVWAKAVVDLTEFLHSNEHSVAVSMLFPHENRVPLELYKPLKDAGILRLLKDVWNIPYAGFNPANSKSTSICKAGHDSVAILPNGDVYGCDLMQAIPEFRAGNVLDNSLSEIFSGAPVFSRLRAASRFPSAASFTEDSWTFSCGQCRAGARNLGALPCNRTG